MNIIGSKIVKTRKPHKCWGCCKEFSAGTRMEVVVSVDGGHMIRAYWCEECKRVSNQLPSWDTQDGLAFGQLAELLEEYLWGERGK